MSRFTPLAALSILVLYLASSQCGKDEKAFPKVTINYFEQCPDYPELPCRYENLTFFDNPDDDLLYVAGYLFLGKVIPEDTVLSVDMRRCMNEKVESCKREQEMYVPDFCTQIPDKTKPWASFIERIENFDPNCPIQTGKYVLKDALINTTALEPSASLFVGHWQFGIKFFSQDSVLLCVVFDADITMRRRGFGKALQGKAPI